MSPKGFLVWTSEVKLVETLGQPWCQARLPCPMTRGILTLQSCLLRTWRHHDVQLQNPRSRTGGYMTPMPTMHATTVEPMAWMSLLPANSHRADASIPTSQVICAGGMAGGRTSRGNCRSEGWELRTQSSSSTRPPLGSISTSLLTVVFSGHPYLSLLHLPAFGTRSRLSLFSW